MIKRAALAIAAADFMCEGNRFFAIGANHADKEAFHKDKKNRVGTFDAGGQSDVALVTTHYPQILAMVCDGKAPMVAFGECGTLPHPSANGWGDLLLVRYSCVG